MAETTEREVGQIHNYYGGLSIRSDDDGKFYWSIEDHNSQSWEEISESLYRELEKHPDPSEESGNG